MQLPPPRAIGVADSGVAVEFSVGYGSARVAPDLSGGDVPPFPTLGAVSLQLRTA